MSGGRRQKSGREGIGGLIEYCWIIHHLIKMNIARKFILGTFAAGFAYS